MNLKNNYYKKLPEKFYQEVFPHKFENPELACFNEDLAEELSINYKNFSKNELAEIFSGKKILPNSNPIALAYAGHQFGHFAPQLGDGRAVLLGEVSGKDKKLYDLQLKGSGKTKFSRNGDGFATLAAVIREYVMSEAMKALDIPTTRSLAIVLTNEPVFREEIFPGAILTRVASSHIRVGTFEYFVARQDFDAVKQLANYAIDQNFPEIKKKNPYPDFFRNVVKNQARLIAKWKAVGFIHGVMNTDNMTISGQTIDYGPCAFLDEYDENKVFSSIDYGGRYAYGNQDKIAKWNLLSLGQCLLPLFDEKEKKAVLKLKEIIEEFDVQFHEFYFTEMAKKLGLSSANNVKLITDLLALMQKHQTDYTITFRKLSEAVNESSEIDFLKNSFKNDRDFKDWLKSWREALQKEKKSLAEIIDLMNKSNPFIIPRNHQVAAVIKSAIADNDFSAMKSFIAVLKNPYLENQENFRYFSPPTNQEKIHQTFCGT